MSHNHNKDRGYSGGLYVPCMTRMAGESYRRRLGSLVLCSCDVFRALVLINSLMFWFCTSALGLVLFEILAFEIDRVRSLGCATDSRTESLRRAKSVQLSEDLCSRAVFAKARYTGYLLITQADVGQLVKPVVQGHDETRLVPVVKHEPSHDPQFTFSATNKASW